jgi:hypothetical protein
MAAAEVIKVIGLYGLLLTSVIVSILLIRYLALSWKTMSKSKKMLLLVLVILLICIAVICLIGIIKTESFITTMSEKKGLRWIIEIVFAIVIIFFVKN